MYMFIIIPIVLLIGLFYKAHKNTHAVSVRHESIGERQNADASSLHVLHLSDMHIENISISPKQLYEILKDEKIDLIALTGDFLDRERTIPKLIPYLQVLRKLNAKHGIYAVFGNHDYILQKEAFDQLRNVFRDLGCKTLQNENTAITVNGARLNIIGIDDHCTKRSDLKKSYKGIAEGFNLVLTHDPNVVLDMEAYDFDYLLSGHFHGGQICWPKPYHLATMGELVRMNIIKGLHFCHGKPFYISEGLGQTLFNIRVGSRPEITIHHLAIAAASGAKSADPVAV